MTRRVSPQARQYDRNCILASTAAQIIAADALGLEIAAVVVGRTRFDVGPVARDIRLTAPAVDLKTAVVAGAGSLALGLAAGLSHDDIRAGLTGERQFVLEIAEEVLAPWLDDGRFVRLVRQLDLLRFDGERPLP